MFKRIGADKIMIRMTRNFNTGFANGRVVSKIFNKIIIIQLLILKQRYELPNVFSSLPPTFNGKVTHKIISIVQRGVGFANYLLICRYEAV